MLRARPFPMPASVLYGTFRAIIDRQKPRDVASVRGLNGRIISAMTNTSKRLEAAVKAWDHHWGDRYGDEALEEMGEEVSVALAAADAVMFSDEAVERAAKAVHDLGNVTPWDERDEELRELYREDARAVIAALKGAGDE